MSAHRIGVIHAYPSRRLLDCLGAAGYRVVLIGNGRALAEHPAVEAVLQVPLWPTDALFSAAAEYHAAHPFSALLPVNEGAVVATAQLSECLGLPGMSLATAVCSRNKYLATLLWEAQGVPVPATLPLTLETPWEQVCQRLGTRVVVKLSDSMNSQGVIAVSDAYQYRQALAALHELIQQTTDVDPLKDRNRFAYGHSSLQFIAQSFCEGREVSVDLLLQPDGTDQVLAVLEKEGGQGPYFAESASVWPTSLGAEQEHSIGQLALRAARALGLTQGAAHVEIRYQHGVPRVLEAGLRPGGGYTAQTIELLSGVDVYAAQVRLLLEQVPLPTAVGECGAVLFGGVVIEASGTLLAVEGMQVFEQLAELRELVVLAHPGDWVQAMPDSAQPHYCYYLLTGESREALLEIHQGIQQQVRLQVAVQEVTHDC